MSVLIYCILPSIFSYIYSLLYCRMRGLSCLDQTRKTVFVKIGSCVIFCYMLMNMTIHKPEISCMIHLLLLELLSGIDIHIRKIPTELLAPAGVLSGILLFQTSGAALTIFSSILIGSVFYFFRNKIGIGSYDILLIFFLAVLLQSMALQLKFAAVFLILWGTAGLIIRALKKGRDLSIPLVPLITFSYYAVQTFL